METFKIRAVISAIECGSLSRAAERLSYTPSALSHLLASLEGELGVRLLDRFHGGVRMTEEGKRLLPRLRGMLESEDRLLELAEELGGGSRELRIGSYSSISRNFLSGILKEFSGRNPDIRLSVSVADDLQGWLEEGRADIIFVDSIAAGKNDFSPLLEDEYRVVGLPSFIDGREVISVEELYGNSYLDTEDAFLDGRLDTARFAEIVRFRSEDDLSVINMVKAGMGFALLPELVLKENLSGVEVARLSPAIRRSLGFACAHGKRAPALRRFLEFLGK